MLTEGTTGSIMSANIITKLIVGGDLWNTHFETVTTLISRFF